MANVLLKTCVVIMCFLCGVGVAFAQKETFHYVAKIKGLEDFKELQENAEKLSQLITPEDADAIASESVLRDFLMSDILQIKQYLQSNGFYDVKIFPEIEEKEDAHEVSFRVYLGEQYTLNYINIFVNGAPSKFSIPNLEIKAGDPAVNQKILKTKHDIAMWFKQNGFPFVEILEELVEVNDDTLLVDVNYYFNVGVKGNFGEHAIEGYQTVNVGYIEKFVQWKVGELYDVRKIKQTETMLMETGLFDSVLISAKAPERDNTFPIQIKLRERTHHNVKVNLYYDFSLSTGNTQSYEIGIIPKYTYNNLFGNNEQFEANTILAYSTQDINVALKKPHFVLFDLSGRVFGSAERRDHIPYFRSGVDSGIGFDYRLSSDAYVDVGLEYENYALTRKTDDSEHEYVFFSTPLAFHVEWLDDKVFSTLGFKTTIDWEPYFSEKDTIYKTNIALTAYVPLFSSKASLGFWTKWGGLSGVGFEDAPADKRLYLGGEQNLRGYSKDSIGSSTPLKDNPEKTIPDGGLSSIAAGIEARFLVYGNVGFGVFANAGQLSKNNNVFEEIKSLDDVYCDFGISLFYFLANIGPVRVDIAHPVGKNVPEAQDNFKLNLTFGQAF